jgi:hypothetical protein
VRVVTWNCCRGSFAKNRPLLDSLVPDIAIIQECARPLHESDACLWFGDNPLLGIAVTAVAPYRLRRLPPLDDVPKFVVPIAVSGPVEFTMLAVWSKDKQLFRYVRAVVKAVEMYRGLIETSPTLLIGDLNSNAIWDKGHPRDLNHSSLVKNLAALGMASAYHAFHNEQQGAETRPTFYLQKNEQRPYHIDYCFVPEVWLQRVRRVDVGKFDYWKAFSDHCPMLVEIAPEPN